VLFAGESTKVRFISEEGFQVLPLHEPDPDMLLDNIRDNKLKFVSDREIELMIDADIALFKETKPDLVLTDFRFTAPVSTQIANLKHSAIVNASSTEYRSLPYIPLFEWVPELIVQRGATVWKALNKINLKLEMFIFDNVMNIFKKFSKQYHLKKTITATNCLTGNDITFLPDIPEYFPTRQLPSDYHYIGPLTWKGNIPPPSWWPPKRDKRPLLYVTMGTTGMEDVFQKLYEICQTSDMVAVITTGAQVQHLKPLQGQIYVEPFIDGDLVMEECDLVVCHGGNGTIYQALQHGKPIIGIPTVPDQLFNMRRVEALEIGKMLSREIFLRNPASLLDMARSILAKNSYHCNASRLREILRTYNASETAADILTKASS
jgi:UDP:flavonoid glycosyltransferase YjiC (YdhE family)